MVELQVLVYEAVIPPFHMESILHPDLALNVIDLEEADDAGVNA